MCGRYTLRATPAELVEIFGLFREPDVRPRYNIAPTQNVLAIRFDENATPREPVQLRWGLIPSWSKDARKPLINARGDTVAVKPAFRSAFKKRRCLIAADGFYEWQALEGRKQPHHIRLRDGRPFAFAGLWERWGDIESCAIITTEANDLIATIHDRMPVILPPDAWDAWLMPDGGNTELLRPYPPEEMELHPVSLTVNNPRNDTPACLEAAGV
ncbi:MAG: SOS response-associated peptidase [Planctomycetaceae bacterium]|nr:SOS response-associated peptidase [Planctomycetaceae bacterium]